MYEVFLNSLAKLRKVVLASSCPSVHMKQLCSLWTDFHEIWSLGFFQNLLRKLKFHKNLTRITGTLHKDQYTFL